MKTFYGSATATLRRVMIRLGLAPDWRTRDHLKLGRQGEALAARYLRRQGMRILRRNFKSGRLEIDLIAGDGGTLVFVEVKTRQSLAYGEPETAVDERKRRRIRAVAKAFARQSRKFRDGFPCRFDIVAIDCSRPDRPPMVRHIKNAFSW